MKMTKDEEQMNFDFYFWLGAEGEAISVTEEEFNAIQEVKRKEREDFINVRYDQADD